VPAALLRIWWTIKHPARGDDERRQAVQDMLASAGKHGFTLGEGLNICGLIHEGRKYRLFLCSRWMRR